MINDRKKNMQELGDDWSDKPVRMSCPGSITRAQSEPRHRWICSSGSLKKVLPGNAPITRWSNASSSPTLQLSTPPPQCVPSSPCYLCLHALKTILYPIRPSRMHCTISRLLRSSFQKFAPRSNLSSLPTAGPKRVLARCGSSTACAGRPCAITG